MCLSVSLGYTMLHKAVYYNFPGILEMALAAGAKVNAQSDNGQPPPPLCHHYCHCYCCYCCHCVIDKAMMIITVIFVVDIHICCYFY